MLADWVLIWRLWGRTHVYTHSGCCRIQFLVGVGLKSVFAYCLLTWLLSAPISCQLSFFKALKGMWRPSWTLSLFHLHNVIYGLALPAATLFGHVQVSNMEPENIEL